jgi:hypothetical protein
MWSAKEAEEFWKDIVADRDKEILELKEEIKQLETELMMLR